MSQNAKHVYPIQLKTNMFALKYARSSYFLSDSIFQGRSGWAIYKHKLKFEMSCGHQNMRGTVLGQERRVERNIEDTWTYLFCAVFIRNISMGCETTNFTRGLKLRAPVVQEERGGFFLFVSTHCILNFIVWLILPPFQPVWSAVSLLRPHTGSWDASCWPRSDTALLTRYGD